MDSSIFQPKTENLTKMENRVHSNLANDFISGSLSCDFCSDEIALCREKLVDWYQKNKRKMPWRGDVIDHVVPPPVTPYGIWISEAMCQQTRVQTAIPYWNNWMTQFPDVGILASSTPDEVNKLWAGLGYYSRAQNLLSAAKKIVLEYDSKIPEKVEDLTQLPGVGPYTAGAISSIAYNHSEAVVDGNVIRVLSRLRALKCEINSGAMKKASWSLARQLLDPVNPGQFNQAVMEFGANVCKPINPDCVGCPISSICRASLITRDSERGDIEDFPFASVTYFPVAKAKKPVPEITYSVCILSKRSNEGDTLFLLVRRPSKGLLANQWEFPCIQLDTTDEESSESGEINLEQFKEYFQTQCSLYLDCDSKHCSSVTVYQPFSHIFSHQKHIMRCFQWPLTEEQHVGLNVNMLKSIKEHQWISPENMISMGVTSCCRKILKLISESTEPAKKRQRKNSVRTEGTK